MISLIVAIDEQRGMGKDNQLLCHLPADLSYFKEMTRGKPIIMGRKTFDSIGKVLPDRLNIILSRQSVVVDGAVVVHSLGQAIERVREYPEIMIIGGASVYEQALPLAQRVYLTWIHHQFAADVFFPPLDTTQWFCRDEVYRQPDAKNQYAMTFYVYERLVNL